MGARKRVPVVNSEGQSTHPGEDGPGPGVGWSAGGLGMVMRGKARGFQRSAGASG